MCMYIFIYAKNSNLKIFKSYIFYLREYISNNNFINSKKKKINNNKNKNIYYIYIITSRILIC